MKARGYASKSTKVTECVIPLCAIRSAAGDNQKEATKSISGMDCATAPTIKAFLPKDFPAYISPMHAPSARCVNESKLNVIKRFCRKILLSPGFRTDLAVRYQVNIMEFYRGEVA